MKPVKPGKEKSPRDNESCASEVEEAIASRNFSARFRPVVSLDTCQIHGHFARVYGPPDSPVRDMARYFSMARERGMVDKLCSRYFEAVLQPFGNSDVGGVLLLTLPAACLAELGDETAHLLAKALKKHDVPADRVMAVFPSMPSAPHRPAIRSLMKHLRQLGVGLAAQGLGCGLDDEAFLDDWPPQLLMLDEHHFEDMDIKAASLDRLCALIRGEAEQGRSVLAQGINTSSQFSLVRTLGMAMVAGDFIGKFSSKPYDMLSAAAYQAIHKRDGGAVSAPQETGRLLDRMLVKRQPVDPATPAEEVFQIFETEPELRAIAVVRDGMPVGLISRYEMIDKMARPFRHELFGRRPCERFMDPDPLTMDVGINLTELTDLVIRADPRHLVSGFIVTEKGRYLGMGAVQDLVREITAMQIEAAKYANPLTQLPGNVPLNQKIDNLLGEQVPFVVAYCDLDHFKPFNDVYGYARGDEIILLTARVLNDAIVPECDFLGHIGGDDFVMIFRSIDWKSRCEQALKDFGEEIQAFFSPSDIAQGGYLATNRKGEMEFCGLTSLSIGAVEIEHGVYANHLSVAGVAAEVKKKAKAIAGNSLYVNKRKGRPHGDAAVTGL